MITMLAAISGESVIGLLIWIVCIGIVFWLLHWLISYVALPEPFAKIARVVLALAGVILLINAIMGLGGHQIIRW